MADRLLDDEDRAAGSTVTTGHSSEGGVYVTEPALLLGAGFSADAGIPTTFEMPRRFRETLASKPQLLRFFDRLVDTLGGLENTDIESLLDALQLLCEPPQALTCLYRARRSFANLHLANDLRAELRQSLRSVCLPTLEAVRPLSAILKVFPEHYPLIITSNYDTCIELIAQDAGLNLSDGYNEEWRAEYLSAQWQRVRLLKVHGSILWYRSRTEVVRVPIRMSDTSPTFTGIDGQPLEPVMLYPGLKNSEFRDPFPQLRRRLEECLEKTDVLCVIGYSFRDDDLTSSVAKWAKSDGHLLIIVDPDGARLLQHLKRFGPRVAVFALKAEEFITYATQQGRGTLIPPASKYAGEYSTQLQYVADAGSQVYYPSFRDMYSGMVRGGFLEMALGLARACLRDGKVGWVTDGSPAPDEKVDAVDMVWMAAYADLRGETDLSQELLRRAAAGFTPGPAVSRNGDAVYGSLKPLRKDPPWEGLYPLLCAGGKSDWASVLRTVELFQQVSALPSLTQASRSAGTRSVGPTDATKLTELVALLRDQGVDPIQERREGGLDLAGYYDLGDSLRALLERRCVGRTTAGEPRASLS